GSGHARTELTGTGTFTLGHGDAALVETLKVTQLPSNSHDIIIGQMFPTGSSPFAMLHFQDDKVYGFVSNQSQEYILMTGIPLGATFSDSIKAVGAKVYFSVTYGGRTATQQLRDISSFVGDTMHFQAGDYEQDAPGSPSNDGGRVLFTQITASGVS
ncbi:MAG TPA: polysaccharide lyase family 7 protein, partial [Acidimicrobiales bacterium]|nr:polysaccharide lyase family 7 protein [Acidimicrobiales bacterium]